MYAATVTFRTIANNLRKTGYPITVQNSVRRSLQGTRSTEWPDLIGDPVPAEQTPERWINREAEVIPRFIVDRPPSAELRPDQIDPFDYDKIAPLIEALIQGEPPLRPVCPSCWWLAPPSTERRSHVGRPFCEEK